MTASSDYTVFATWMPSSGVGNATHVYNASIMTQAADLTMQLSVQTWDVVRSQYQAVNCTGVSRSYSVSVEHNSSLSSMINVHDSRLISPVLSQPGMDPSLSPGNNISFTQDYIVGGMTISNRSNIYKRLRRFGLLRYSVVHDRVTIQYEHQRPWISTR